MDFSRSPHEIARSYLETASSRSARKETAREGDRTCKGEKNGKWSVQVVRIPKVDCVEGDHTARIRS